jgi:hypothetical protein
MCLYDVHKSNVKGTSKDMSSHNLKFTQPVCAKRYFSKLILNGMLRIYSYKATVKTSLDKKKLHSMCTENKISYNWLWLSNMGKKC